MQFVGKLLLAAAALAPLASHAFSLEPGGYYASNGKAVNHYDTHGSLLESLAMDAKRGETRGIAFNHGEMYVVRENTFGPNGPGAAGVDVFDRGGQLKRSYSFGGWIGGLVTAGNIQFNPAGNAFYVGAQDGVYRFDLGASYGEKLIGTEANDLKVLDNGDLLVAGEYGLTRFSATGQQLGSVSRFVDDPLGLTKGFNYGGNVMLTDVRGIEYDAATDTTFVTMLGYTGYQTDMGFKLLALDGFSNRLKGISDYWHGADMALAPDHRLLVGSWTQAPGVFNIGSGMPLPVGQVGKFQGGDAIFVAAMPVPEPQTLALMAAGLGVIGLLLRRTRRQG